MIIWRGWGILAILFIPLGAVGFGALTDLAFGKPGGSLPIGIGLIMSGVLLYFAGTWFQNWDAERRITKHIAAREIQVRYAVDSGHFQPTPGYQPKTYQEAQLLAAQMLQHEREAGLKKLRGYHTVFYIPIQYVGFVLCAIGVVLIGISFGGS